MNTQIDLKIKSDVYHDVYFSFKYLFGPFFNGLFWILLGVVFPLFKYGSHLVKDILWISKVFGCLGADKEGSTEVREAIEVVVGENFDLAVEEPKRKMDGLKRKF